MATVIPRPNENFESLLRRFKKLVERSGVLSDLRKHESFEKPGDKRRRKQAAARKRAAKRLKKFDRVVKKSNVNFRFNKDRTEKIPTAPPTNNKRR